MIIKQRSVYRVNTVIKCFKWEILFDVEKSQRSTDTNIIVIISVLQSSRYGFSNCYRFLSSIY